jgi:hypothetical protein
MKIVITESQLRNIIIEQPESTMDRRLGIEKTNMKAVGLNPSSPSDVRSYSSSVFGKPFTGHEVATILQIGTAFIPVVGPFISSGIGFLEAKSYWDEGNKQEATLVAIFSSLPMIGSVVMKIPGVKQLGQKGMTALASKISKLGEKFKPTKVEQEIIQGIEQNIDLIKTEVKNTTKNFNLERTTVKPKKLPWDYAKRKLTDKLEFIGKPKGGDVAEVKNLINPGEYVALKKGTDDLGEYYYMSAKMTNPRDAGTAFNELKKLIPSGARFGESATGSLSTDSFYSMLRRAKEFIPKVKNYIKLNGDGVKRFQDFIKNPVKSDAYPNILRFKNIDDAKELMNGINGEIKKYGISVLSKIKKNEEGLFEILIPNIELIVP